MGFGVSSLTTGLDTIAGSTGDDTASAIISATTATTTLTGGDTFNGGEGTDTLSILIDSNMTANTMMPNLTNVENVVVRNLSVTATGAGANIVDELSMIQAQGVQNVHLDSSVSLGDLNVTNAPLAATYAVLNTPAEAATPAALSVSYNTVDIAGKTDTANFKVSGAGSKIGVAAPNFAVLDVTNTSGVEAVTVATSGVNYAQIKGAGTDTKTVSITGDGVNTLVVADTASTLTIDASASTGTNIFSVGTTVSSSDVIKGGSGLDVVSLKMTDATGVSFTGIEAIQIAQGSDSGKVLSFAANPAAAIVVRDSDSSDVFRLANAWATDVTFEGADVSSSSSATLGLGAPTNDVSFGTLQLDTAHSGVADVMNVNLSNQGVNATTGYSATVKASGVETVNLVQSDIIATNTTTFTLNNPGMTTFTASSDGNVNVTLNTTVSSAPNYPVFADASKAGTSSLKLIDFSGVAGTNSLTFGNVSEGQLASGAEIKTSVKGGSLTLGLEAATDAITVTGNVGVDNITVSGGSITANLGDGNDIISAAGQNAAKAPGKLVANGDAGDDQLTGGYAADTLNGGAGSDTLDGNGGADLLDGGEGSDTYKVTSGDAKVTSAAVNQVTILTFAGMGAGETLKVAIGGETYVQAAIAAFSSGTETAIDASNPFSLAATLAAFKAKFASDILAKHGLTLDTANDTNSTPAAAGLKFTANGTYTELLGGVQATGYSFTKPTAEIVNTASGMDAGSVYTDVQAQSSVIAGTAFDGTNGKSFTFSVKASASASTASTYTVNWNASLENSLKAFAAANPTIQGAKVEYSATIGGSTKGLVLTTQDNDGTPPVVVTGATGTGGSVYAGLSKTGSVVAVGSSGGVTVASVATTNLAIGGTAVKDAEPAEASTASDSSYLEVTGLGIASAMDTVQWGAGDIIDYTNASISVTAVAAVTTAGSERAGIADTGIVSFVVVPTTLQAALTDVNAAIHASGSSAGTVDGEAAIFQFGGETFVYISDAVAGHDRSDTVIKLVGTPEDLVSGLTISDGNITNIG
mgnify:CR=1 FL=1